MEVPERFHGTDIRLYFECVHTSYRLHGTGPTSMGRSFRWYTIELLDGARLERQASRTLIPFAVRLPADAPPTSNDTLNRARVDWTLRVQAIRPGARYKLLSEWEFEVAVEPSDAAVLPATATPLECIPTPIGHLSLTNRYGVVRPRENVHSTCRIPP